MAKNALASIPTLKNKVMEKRKDHRHTLELESEVYFVEQEVEGKFQCRTQNIGLKGAFIPSGTIPVESMMFVEVVLKSKTKWKPGQQHNRYRLQAQVVHRSETGAGLEFKMLDQAHQLDFRRFLFKAKIAARH